MIVAFRAATISFKRFPDMLVLGLSNTLTIVGHLTSVNRLASDFCKLLTIGIAYRKFCNATLFGVAWIEVGMGHRSTIKSIRASVHNVDLKVPLVDKPVGNRSIVFCQVETADGTVGYGMTEYFLTHAIKAAIDHHFAPLMIGMDLTDVEKIHTGSATSSIRAP